MANRRSKTRRARDDKRERVNPELKPINREEKK